MSAADRPVVVLLPGAWHPATTWDLVRAELEPQYQTVAIALPSTDFNASADHLTDAAIVSDTVQHLADLERDIVLVTHSYGGLVGAEACKGLTRRERQAQGKKGGIAAFVAISACTFVAGQSVVTAGGGYLAPQISINKGTGLMTISGTKGFWYGDLPQELADATTAKLGCQSYASFLSKLTHTPWDDVPVVWIRCLKDQAYPLLAQDRMIENIGGPGKTKIIDLDSSHSPMLSMPMRCADVIVEACSGIAPSG